MIVSDNDGDRHYIIPSDKRLEASEYFDEAQTYWENFNSDVRPEEPTWLERIPGGPSLVEFTNYVIVPDRILH